MKRISAKVAQNYRKKRKRKTASPDELAALAHYEKTRKLGRPKKSEAPKPEPEPTPAKPDVIPVDRQLMPPETLGDEPSGRPPPDPPPSFLGASSKEKKGGDWRSKYRAETVGREALCTTLADGICKILRSMEATTVELGGKAAFDEDTFKSIIYPAWVLTVDKLAPADLTSSPELIVAASSSAVITKRLYYGWRSNKTQAQEKQREEKARSSIDPTGDFADDKPTDDVPANAPVNGSAEHPFTPGPAHPPGGDFTPDEDALY